MQTKSAVSAVFRKCHKVLRWEIGDSDFPGFRSLFPYTHDPRQKMFWKGLHISMNQFNMKKAVAVNPKKDPFPYFTVILILYNTF